LLLTARFDVKEDAYPNQPFNQEEQETCYANTFKPFDHEESRLLLKPKMER